MKNGTSPKFKSKAFNCPHCGAYANQFWEVSTFGSYYDQDLHRSSCVRCSQDSYWYKEKLTIPDSNGFDRPNIDLGEEIIADYLEAASISQKSPRGAAALLRLAIQKLCIQLGEKGNNINNDIGELVKKGLSPKVQKMLDIVRVIGNNAVHPGQMNLNDNPEIVRVLAKLINEVADEMITKPRELNELYSSLPEGALSSIDKRDSKK